MTEIEKFNNEVQANIARLNHSMEMKKMGIDFVKSSAPYKYSYNFSWLGRPIIQYPQDMTAMQEIIWSLQPDLIIETGIAHGGSLIMNASFLAMLDYCDAAKLNQVIDPNKPKRKVLGIDIDIRAHNRTAIEAHPMSNHIEMFQGSSIDADMIKKVHEYAKDFNCILVALDSNHTHAHVLAELEAYAPLVTKGSYCVVFDTIIEDMAENSFPDRPWDKGNNAKTAVWKYLENLSKKQKDNKDTLQFEIDAAIESKLLITVAPDGYLKRIN
ncbi:cephalosporin hydroxylase family protein [Candidatus Venteria ishoeyi]|uniref:cephalosporin hydroxylase family protein n=1 Tax=Candidatus Venteria ishoeyi TaxID=1899563 RepID=UPI0025A5C8AA|nr:cephalosporin hydroxylase family protein [Candidatus Venteria ishoeyi]MDM8546569.1 cephalosporin hydroxylase family protein [Candidatus Venteria ishoeyi]